MICQTVKPGIDCFFMSKKGCQFNGGACFPIIDKCEGCEKAKEFPTGKFCILFPDPGAKWRLGNCNMATHVERVAKKEAAKLNPIKASKRGSR